MLVSPDSVWSAWNPDPLVVVPLVAAGWMYMTGARALWRSAGRGRGVRIWQVGAFTSGLVAVAIALISPLDAISDVLFAAHMGQHLVLMSIAAPLLALGAPSVPLLWSLSRANRVRLGRLFRRVHPIAILATLPVAFGLHSLALWLWHAPPLYEGALRNPALHALEHLCLLGTGFVFWTAAFHRLVRGTRAPGAAVLYVFALGAQCTGLGALITLSTRPWYATYSSGAWGLSAMDDQVLAGALMWVPAGMLYLGYALLLLGAWLRPSTLQDQTQATEHERSAQQRQQTAEPEQLSDQTRALDDNVTAEQQRSSKEHGQNGEHRGDIGG
jgi:cytochrome c oxidase assembly factor CtaG